MRNTSIIINHAALAHNLNAIKNTLNPHHPAKVLAMVKADAYGHGIAHTLLGLKDADAFGVACMSEALAVQSTCNALGMKKPIILIEGVFSEAEWLIALEHGFGCVIHGKEQLEFAIKHPASQGSLTNTIWLKYNTGMNRLGFDKQGAIDAAKALHKNGYQLILTSHFACADEPNSLITDKQITLFKELLDTLCNTVDDKIQASLCNSAGIISQPNCHYDWVRTGIMLYGSSPFAHITADELGLKPAMTLTTSVMAIQRLNKGDTVSYGALWTAKRSSRIGIISCGYGDGYPRVVAGAWVGVVVDGQVIRTPIVGRVAMDIMMIDLTDIATADIGTSIVLWGMKDAPSIDEIAACAGTIGYEVMCRTTTRPHRVVTF